MDQSISYTNMQRDVLKMIALLKSQSENIMSEDVIKALEQAAAGLSDLNRVCGSVTETTLSNAIAELELDNIDFECPPDVIVADNELVISTAVILTARRITKHLYYKNGINSKWVLSPIANSTQYRLTYRLSRCKSITIIIGSDGNINNLNVHRKSYHYDNRIIKQAGGVAFNDYVGNDIALAIRAIEARDVLRAFKTAYRAQP